MQLVGDAENLYAACSRSGLWRYSSNQWTRIEARGFPEESPVVITQDSLGRIWAGYTGNKVGLLDGSSAKTYFVDDAPGLGNVQAILVTRQAVLAGWRAWSCSAARRSLSIPACGRFRGSTRRLRSRPSAQWRPVAQRSPRRIPYLSRRVGQSPSMGRVSHADGALLGRRPGGIRLSGL